MRIPVSQVQLADAGYLDVDADSPYVFGVETAGELFSSIIGHLNLEVVGLICLDSTHKIVNYVTIAIGLEDKVSPSVAQIMRVALLSNASYILVAHNHPSGTCEITEPDVTLTKRIGSAAMLLGISLIDSLIVGPNGELSSIRESMGVEHAV